MAENPPEPGIGGGVRSVTRSASGVISKLWKWIRSGSRSASFANNVTREMLETAALDPGPKIAVATKPGQIPQINRQLYV